MHTYVSRLFWFLQLYGFMSLRVKAVQRTSNATTYSAIGLPYLRVFGRRGTTRIFTKSPVTCEDAPPHQKKQTWQVLRDFSHDDIMDPKRGLSPLMFPNRTISI